MAGSRSKQLILALQLEPHPEGGFYREVFRSPAVVKPGDGRGTRAALSAIYFLLGEGGTSRWHSVRSDEQWTFLEGDPLELLVIDRATFGVTVHRLGASSGGDITTAVVPGGAWQAARALGTHALVTCTVGPGFDFADFAFMADDAAAAARLRGEAPDLVRLL
ncbi:MAG: cupin domain-containing protein [Candidatus Krumholzibacteria bacterium]|nr:cupin domain-containing protein [Candidatus Krumholzibacteria bacterium]MDH4338096.1 cupin domain-containing protein [Candidatus Krumholzibacteria bacterium]MDH5270921.1 cupin domain-containing protein [Candidatus Krumholzibacteria bacterium]MDH5628222.1 cupin domain-containing protein [Candidatus Krumholzibacteria bacterium]